jgi:hypothetical protein
MQWENRNMRGRISERGRRQCTAEMRQPKGSSLGIDSATRSGALRPELEAYCRALLALIEFRVSGPWYEFAVKREVGVHPVSSNSIHLLEHLSKK